MNSCKLCLNVVLIAIWFACGLNAQTMTNFPATLSASEMTTNNARLFNEFTNQAQIENSYRAGLITKGEAMQATVLNENRKSMDIYGKVVDQSGQPIVGARVRGFLEFEEKGNNEEHDTQADEQRRFQFLGLHGKGLAIILEKEGYEFNLKYAVNRPNNYLPDSNNPLIVTMWKLRGAEPMKHTKIGTGIACDGSLTQFDMLSGKKSANGDLIVKLTRNPINIDRRKPFNWSVTLQISNGGFREITNLYPNEAPTDGYQPTLTLDFPTNMVGWQPEFQHSYYFKSKSGKVYGRINFDIYGNFQPPPTYFGAEVYANPGGSINLEFDNKKQIR